MTKKYIEFSVKETKTLLRLKIGSKRQKFSAKFLAIINEKIHKIGINCFLEESWNWFKRINSRKKGPFWSGVYYCVNRNCKTKFTLKLNKSFKLGDNVTIDVFYKNPKTQHELITSKKKTYISKEERKKLALDTKIKGVQIVRSENINFNIKGS